MEHIDQKTIVELTSVLRQVSDALIEIKKFKETNIQEEKKLLKPEEVMKLLGVGRNTLYTDLFQRDDFPKIRIGRNFLISRIGLDQWINAQSQCKK